MRLSFSCPVFAFLGLCYFVEAQEIPLGEQLLEEVTSADEISENTEAYVDMLDYLLLEPLNLNSATGEEMQQVLRISSLQAEALVNYRIHWSPIISIAELYLIDTWDSATIDRIAPFVVVPFLPLNDTLTFRDLFHYPKQQLVARISGVAGKRKNESIENPYMGNGNKILFRYKYSVKKRIQAGFIMEKDVGESIGFSDHRAGFDYNSAYVSYKGKGFIHSAILGDYHLQFGQGLTFWSGFAISNGLGMVSARRIGLNIRPHSGSEENDFLRGTALRVKLGPVYTTVFISNHNRDANFSAFDSIADCAIYSGFKTGGYHRTFEELEEKNNLTETLAGANIVGSFHNITMGITGYYQHIDGIILPQESYFNWNKFSGSDNMCLGADFCWAFHKTIFYGEASRSKNGGYAIVAGCDFHPDARIEYSIHYRNTSADFQNMHCTIFRNSSGTNQQGIYTGLIARLSSKISVQAWADRLTYMYAKTGCHKPGTEQRYSARILFKPVRYTVLYLQTSQKEYTHDNGSENQITWDMEDIRSQSFRVHLTMEPTKRLRFQSRVEYCRVQPDGIGVLCYQDASYKSSTYPINVAVRYTLFDTDGFGARIYSYESDALYSFSIPAYYDRGRMGYIYLSWRPYRLVTIYFKYARTNYAVPREQEQGWLLSDPGHKSTYNLQVRLSL